MEFIHPLSGVDAKARSLNLVLNRMPKMYELTANLTFEHKVFALFGFSRAQPQFAHSHHKPRMSRSLN